MDYHIFFFDVSGSFALIVLLVLLYCIWLSNRMGRLFINCMGMGEALGVIT